MKDFPGKRSGCSPCFASKWCVLKRDEAKCTNGQRTGPLPEGSREPPNFTRRVVGSEVSGRALGLVSERSPDRTARGASPVTVGLLRELCLPTPPGEDCGPSLGLGSPPDGALIAWLASMADTWVRRHHWDLPACREGLRGS